MRFLLLGLSLSALAQNIPGLGTDPLQKSRPPVVYQRMDASDHLTAAAAQDQARAALQRLLDEAQTLQKELDAGGSHQLQVQSLKRLDRMKKDFKAIESALKRK